MQGTYRHGGLDEAGVEEVGSTHVLKGEPVGLASGLGGNMRGSETPGRLPDIGPEPGNRDAVTKTERSFGRRWGGGTGVSLGEGYFSGV